MFVHDTKQFPSFNCTSNWNDHHRLYGLSQYVSSCARQMVCSGDGFRCSFPPTALMRPALYFWESHNRNCNSIKSSRTRQTNAHTHTSAEKIFPYVKLNSIYYIPCCGKQYGYPNYNMQGNCIFFGWLLFAISMSMPSRRTCTESPCDVWKRCIVLATKRLQSTQPAWRRTKNEYDTLYDYTAYNIESLWELLFPFWW